MPEAVSHPAVASSRTCPDRSAGTFAAIDLGTNNCRLLVGVPTSSGSFRVLDSYSRVVRLGEGLAAHGLLSEGAMSRALAALQTCAQKLLRRPLRRLLAVTTEACRQARNGPAFVAEARAATGLPIRIISAREEAELAMESCAPLLRAHDRRALLFDIGGGSTEIAWIRSEARGSTELIGYVSLPLGVVTLAERAGLCCGTPEGFRHVVEEVVEELARFDRVHSIAREMRAGGVRLMGTSGTVTTLAGVALALPRYSRPLIDGRVLDTGAADQALRDLFALGPDGLRAHPCIGPERADFVLPGCAIYAAIRKVWPSSSVTVADRGLREGMLLRMMRQELAAPRRAASWQRAAAHPAP
ncbi:Ppx/GppA family phosphatase [Roseomonas sp. M0104]|uniref:Ppx/GppA family phosphatase n=1 Tax=Teichococcus coralli TaxID=2545983 RepID=A0A845BD62_9PROT|nr:Ppx/GppA phosphatase family protein [Pseudoroseomonas coralli]MXP63287.1 Ppx/GppA family phosphatase [Pseudoroseomonas coralli]